MEMWPLPWYLFFLKKQNKFKKHETQNAEILRNIARLTLTNMGKVTASVLKKINATELNL